MIKTLTTIVSKRIANSGPSVMMPLGKIAEESFVWYFEFGSLGFIWDLDFGAWNFQDFH